MAAATNPYYTSFPQTGHNLGGGFREFWTVNDGLRLFGYPMTEEMLEFNFADNITYTVQYFERARLEVHRDANGGPARIVIGRLGSELTEGAVLRAGALLRQHDAHVYFAATQHSINDAFYQFWRAHGGLTRFGYPISEELQVAGQTVQYFERARFEYHPENGGTDQEVGLGLLGTEALTRRGWLPLTH